MRGKAKTSKKERRRSTSMIEIIKPPSDFRHYRVVILPNGITSLLISEGSESSGEIGETEENSDVNDSADLDGEAAAALCIGIGSFSDPLEVPGFAHFMEHMVFMGSKKFPKENFWDELLSKNGGESNAWTDCERTCFFFTSQQTAFGKALDAFAQFFISPLFNKNSVDREIMAVDNECQMVASNDSERMRSIISHAVVEEGHPMKKFMAGNMKSLKEIPEKNKVNVYDKLHDFYQNMYSAHYMTLVVHSSENLDALESRVINIFSKIPNNGIPCPKFIKVICDKNRNSTCTTLAPPFQERNFNKVIKVLPMEDVHKMELIWALPPLQEHYRDRIVEFLGVLLGHEGKGSILSFLRKKNLVLEIKGGNDMTGYTHNSTWTAFILSIKLTTLGASHFTEVLDTVYQYIKLLRQDLPAHTFMEQKHIQETKYIFQDQEALYSYVEEVAENMHLFPPEHYLCGRTLYFEFNKQLINECLDFLQPHRMLLLMYSKAYSNLMSLNEEPWLGTKFHVNDMDQALINQLNNLSKNPELAVPELNPYIATDFSMVTSKRSTKYPVVVMEQDACRMWYKKDNKFYTPSAYIYLNFVSSCIAKTSQNVALGDIYLSILLQKLTETLYNATLAGYEYTVEGTPEGMVFFLGGYSDKIKLVTEDTLKAFLELELTEDTFNSVVDHLRQVYINELIKPVELARSVRYSLLEEKDPSLLERYDQLTSLTFPMLLQFKEDFQTNLFVEGFVTGNLKPKDAIIIGELASKVVKKPLPEVDFPKPNMLELPEGEHKCFMSAINKEDTNSCVALYFQQGLGTFHNQCLNEVLASIMREPFFRTLRTEHQMGYSVYCNHTITHGVLGFILVVECQANKFSMKHVEETMNQFLISFEKELKDIPEQKFSELLENQSYINPVDDSDMFDESGRFWQEIVLQSYVFDRTDKQNKAMMEITRADVIAWYQTLISERKRKLSVMVEGCTKSKCEMVFAETSNPLSKVKTLVQGLRTCARNVTQVSTQSRTVKGKEPLVSPQPLGEEYISNICKFRRSLKPFPYHIIKN